MLALIISPIISRAVANNTGLKGSPLRAICLRESKDKFPNVKKSNAVPAMHSAAGGSVRKNQSEDAVSPAVPLREMASIAAAVRIIISM